MLYIQFRIQTESISNIFISVAVENSLLKSVMTMFSCIKEAQCSQKDPAPCLPRYQTQFMNILLQAEQIPILDNILASFSTWFLLAGYLVFPATFTSLRKSSALQSSNDVNMPKKMVAHAVQNAPVLLVAAICCCVGCFGMLWFWNKWSRVFTWVINRLIM